MSTVLWLVQSETTMCSRAQGRWVDDKTNSAEGLKLLFNVKANTAGRKDIASIGAVYSVAVLVKLLCFPHLVEGVSSQERLDDLLALLIRNGTGVQLDGVDTILHS